MRVRWDAPLITVDDLEEIRTLARELADDPALSDTLGRSADEVERLWRLVGAA